MTNFVLKNDQSDKMVFVDGPYELKFVGLVSYVKKTKTMVKVFHEY